MNENLKEYLREMEEVLWDGKPEGFAVLAGKNKISILLRSVLVALIAGGFIAGHVASMGAPKMGLVAAIAIAAVAALLAPWWEKQQVMKNRYWITDQRVIQQGKNGLFYSLDLEEIDVFKVVSDGTVKNCLVLGSCVFEDAEKQPRWRTNTPKCENDRGSHAEGMILYHISDVDKAVGILKSRGCALVA